MPHRRRSDRANHPDDATLATRLAELVSELTGSPTDSALVAVRSEGHDHGRDALEVVAAAMVHLDGPDGGRDGPGAAPPTRGADGDR